MTGETMRSNADMPATVDDRYATSHLALLRSIGLANVYIPFFSAARNFEDDFM